MQEKSKKKTGALKSQPDSLARLSEIRHPNIDKRKLFQPLLSTYMKFQLDYQKELDSADFLRVNEVA